MNRSGRRGRLAGAALVLLLCGTNASAQNAGPPPGPFHYKIGFVNTERVMRDSRASQQIQKSLEAEFEKRAQEIDGGPAGDVGRRRNALAEDMNLRREDALKEFTERTNGVIRRIAEAEQLDVVFYEAAYTNARIDMTDRVIKALDAER